MKVPCRLPRTRLLSSRRLPSGLAALALLTLLPAAAAEDWPCYRKDARRSAVTSERLAFPLEARWVREVAAPRPAWPEPGRAANPLDFDRASEPVAAAGLVYVASSSDDTLYAFRSADGAVAWTYTADAPLRFAPHLDGGRCYLAGDDGAVVALDARTGTVAWSHNPMPERRLIAGNGRMISRWPCRSGVLVLDGVVYGTAGMWPAEGTCAFALDAKTGRTLWCNDTTDAMYVAYPHDGLSRGGPTPQGYLLTDGRVLVAPTGLSGPAGFDLRTGRFLFWPEKGPGSAWACLGEGVVMTAGIGWQNDQDVRLGEGPLWEADGIAFFSLPDGRYTFDRKWAAYRDFPGSARKGRERMRGQIDPIGGRDRAVWTGDTLYLSGMGSVEAVDTASAEIRPRWRVDHPRVYALALAGDALIAGGDGVVTAFRAVDGTVVWKAAVDGQARGLSVAGGLLCVSTDRGTLYAFGAGGVAATPAAKPDRPAAPAAPPPLPGGLDADPCERGFALVVGRDDTALAEALAARTRLNVIALLRDAAAVDAARKRLLGGPYGTGVVVHAVPPDGRLPYADYFANRVVVDGGAGGVAPAELRRVLHPCSGRMHLLHLGAEAADALLRQAGVPAGEAKADGGCVTATRGPLPGAFDWNTTADTDERVRWPLELLWFGGPGRDRMQARHATGYPPPIPAHGRVFVQGQVHVIAVDAYNGTELWSHHVPGYRYVAADAAFAYLGVRDGVIVCDAQTGRVAKAAGAFRPAVFPLDTPRTFETKKGNKHAGALRIAKDAGTIELVLDTVTPAPDDKDAWIFRFDFRAPSERLDPPGRGCFPLVIATRTATRRACDLAPEAVAPEAVVTRAADAPGRILVRIPLDRIRALTGSEPAGFDLAAELQLFQGERRWLSEMPLTGGQDPMRNGTATFVLAGAADPSASPWARVERVEPAALPPHAKDWGRTPLHKRHDGNIPVPPLAAERQPGLRERLAALTGASQDRRYLRAYGCSGTIASATMDFFRSGTLGMYDLADDSGMRNFPGLKPGCRITLLPALGVLFSAEGNADCFCPYSFATSLALAPAARRRNEDWALYYGPTDAAPVRRYALNLGAPGDRRDNAGTLWLGFPRPPMAFATGGSFGPEPHTLDVPVTLETVEGARPVRVNADRVPLPGTDLPWVCASGLLGVRSMRLGLVFHDPRAECLAYAAEAPPRVDGRLDDAAWHEDPGIAVSDRAEGGRVRIRHDAQHLYLAYEEPAGAPPKDAPAGRKPAKASAFDVVLKDARLPLAVQLNVAAGGGRSGAAVSCAVDVPRVSGVTVDGRSGDWGAQGLELGLPEERGTLRLGWSAEGLLALVTLPRDFFSVDRAWTSLRLQLIGPASPAVLETVIDAAGRRVETFEASLAPEGEGRTRDLAPFRATRPAGLRAVAGEAGDALAVELLVPIDRLGAKPAVATRLGLKLVAFNPKSPDANIATGGGSRRALAEGRDALVLTLADGAPPAARLKAVAVERAWYGAVVRHAPPPVALPADAWSGAAREEDGALRAEIAVPFRLLDALGVAREGLLALFQSPVRMRTEPAALDAASRSARRIAFRPPEAARGTRTVRLHFAEIAGAVPGERVFTIRLQGKTVAEAVDVAREAGGPLRGLTRTFPGVEAGRVLEIELVPEAGGDALPILCGVEVIPDPGRPGR